jgi:ATP-dependent RNA helicase DDX52/ROK1
VSFDAPVLPSCQETELQPTKRACANTLPLDAVQRTRYLILDEADRLLSPDFFPQVEPIVRACSNEAPGVQKCFLSATMEAGAEALARCWLKEGGVRVVVGLK